MKAGHPRPGVPLSALGRPRDRGMRPPALLLIAAGALVALVVGETGDAMAAVVSWNNASGGNWSDVANWTPNQVPGSQDDAVITLDGTYTVSLNVDATVASLVVGGTTGTQTFSNTTSTLTLDGASMIGPNGRLSFGGGTITGGGDLTIESQLAWTGGTMSGTGVINANGGIAMSGTAIKDLVTRTLNNPGAATWTGTGAVRLGSGAVINNTGLWDAQNDAAVTVSLATPRTFNNMGTFRKSAGSGTTTVSVTFNNSGTVEVQTGTLNLTSGGAGAGSFIGSGGTTLQFSGGTHDLNGGSSIAAPAVMFTAGTVNLHGSYNVSGSTTVSGAATVQFAADSSVATVGASLAISGGTASFDSGETIGPGTLSLSGGSLEGSDEVTVSGLTTWTGGTMSGTGVINANGGIAMSGTAVKDLVTRTLNNPGTATWTGTGAVRLGSGAVINNAGLWDAQSNATLSAILGTPRTFNNLGTFRKSAGSGTTTVSVTFNNTGAVQVQTGTLNLTLGGTSTGSFIGSAGTTLQFSGGTHDLNGGSSIAAPAVMFTAGTVNLHGSYNVSGSTTVSGAATVQFAADSSVATVGASLAISGGTASFDSGETIGPGTLSLSGGSLEGSDEVTVSGLTTWTGGTMSGTGVINANGGIAMSGTAVKDLVTRTLNNPGTATWTGTGAVRLGSGAVINNAGLWDAQSNATLSAILGTPRTFNNLGTFRKSAGSGTTTVSVTFNNTGAVQVQTGTLNLTLGGTSTGSFIGSAGTTLQFSGGTHDLNGGSSIAAPAVMFTAGTVNLHGSYNVSGSTTVSGAATVQFAADSSVATVGASLAISGGTASFDSGETIGPGTLSLSGGSLEGSDEVTVSGLTTWTGGTMSGTGVINANGGIAMSGTAVKDLVTRTLNNPGTATWTGTGAVRLGSGAVINNAGLWDAQSNATLSAILGTPRTFNNLGTFRKSAGSGTTTVSVTFNNTGALQALSGTLSFTAVFTQTSGSTTLNGGALASTSPASILGGRLEGAGTVTGDVTSSGLVAPGLSSGILVISGDYAQTSSGAYNVEVGGLSPGTQFDQLNLTGTAAASLAGALDVSLINGFTPAEGDSFTIMSFASLTGAFSTANLPRLGGTIDWQVAYGPASVVLNVIGGFCPDNDKDGFEVCDGCNVRPGDACGDCNDANPAIHPGATDICDLLDNNCNGSVDEDFGGGPEVCNGIDDNCNGLIDEGNPGGGGLCSTGELGVCSDGAFSCTAGALACLRAGGPGPEICNGLDDNCEGTVDESLDSDGDGVTDCADNCPDAFNQPSDCDGNPGTPPVQCDGDGDGIGDVCDCTPSDPDNPPPPEVGGNLDVTMPAGQTSISWGAVPQITQYNIYRGYRTQGDPWVYDQECLSGGVSTLSGNDPAEPRIFTVFYYLVSSKCGTFESILGRDPLMNPVPLPFRCPAPAQDLDGDGAPDAADNCPGFRNPSQSDVDADSHGDTCDNCPADFNPSQTDTDDDGVGDACDPP